MKRLFKYWGVMFLLSLLYGLSAKSVIASEIPSAFLEIGMGGRAMAMGGAYVALVDDASGVIWNPAGLPNSNLHQAVFAYTNQLGLIPYRFVGYSQPLLRDFVVGGGVTTSGDEALKENTVYFSVARPIKAGFSRFLGDLNVGGTAKIRTASFGKNPDGGPDRVTGDAMGYGLDLGCLIKPGGGLSIGVLLRDMTAPVEWNSSVSGKYTEDVPSTFIVGVGLERRGLFGFSADVENNERVRAGMEVTVLGIIGLRGGYSQRMEAGAIKNYSAGIGITQKLKNGIGFNLDLAYSFHDLGNSPRGSFSIGF